MIQEISNRLKYSNSLNLHQDYSSDSSSSSSSSNDSSDSDEENTSLQKDNKLPVNDSNVIPRCYREQFAPNRTPPLESIKQNDLQKTYSIAEVPVWTNNDQITPRKRFFIFII